MNAVGKTDVGITRSNNEDYFVICEELNLYVVADGMGGHNAGEVASKLACETIISKIKEMMAEGRFSWENDIEQVVEHTNDVILQYVAENPNCRGMGTTLVIAYLEEGSIKLINIGDSRCYGYTKEGLLQLTKDHSLVAELVKLGTITQEEAQTHPDRNIITSALGVSKQYEIYRSMYPCNRFDGFLLCTDGLTNMVSNEEILKLIVNEAFDRLPNQLVSLANKMGGKDNITVVCVENKEV